MDAQKFLRCRWIKNVPQDKANLLACMHSLSQMTCDVIGVPCVMCVAIIGQIRPWWVPYYIPNRNLNYKAQNFSMVMSSLDIHRINGHSNI